MRVTSSGINSFESCQLRGYWLGEMPRDKASARTANDSNRYGAAQHAVLEDVFGWAKAQAYAGPMHSPEVLSIAKQAIGRRCEERDIDDGARLQMWEAVLDYLMTHNHLVGTDIVGTEIFLRSGRTPGGNQLTGFADRIDRLQGGQPGVRIVDYKGGNGKPSPDEVRASIQGQIYVACALTMYPWAQIIDFRLDHLGSRHSATARWNRLEASWQAEEIMRFADTHAAERVSPPWLPNTGRHCNWCPFNGAECPATGGTVPEGWYDPTRPVNEQQRLL